MEIRTYRDLLNHLLMLGESQLDQTVQVVAGGETTLMHEPVELQPVIAIGAVDYFEFWGVRSSVDNKYHADEIVILCDHGPFGADGATSYILDDKALDEASDESVPDEDYDIFKGQTPCYTDAGPTDRDDQINPSLRKIGDGELHKHDEILITRRVEDHHSDNKEI